MKLFRFPKRDPGRFEDDTPGLKIARHILLVLLFCGVALGFWLNSQRHAAMFVKPAPRILDTSGSLTDEERKVLAAYSEKFLATYGISIMIRIQHEPFPEKVLPASEAAGTLFLGLSPKNGQVRLEVPPLAAGPLGEHLIAHLRHGHFPPYFARNNWQEGLASALNLLTEKLDHALSGRGNATQRIPSP